MKGGEKLRDEIMALHAAQRDLVRWKLIGVGVLASIALGLSSSAKPIGMAICLVPFFVAYCDLLCREYDLRVAVISAFFRNNAQDQSEDVFVEYEQFIKSQDIGRLNLWIFGHASIVFSSSFACSLTLIVGSIIISTEIPSDYSMCDVLNRLFPYITSAILGLVASIFIQREFNNKHDKLQAIQTLGKKCQPPNIQPKKESIQTHDGKVFFSISLLCLFVFCFSCWCSRATLSNQ